MTLIKITELLLVVAAASTMAVQAQESAPVTDSSTAMPSQPLTAEAINGAPFDTIPAAYAPAADGVEVSPDPAIVRLQVMLDRAGASPGVVDGFDGDNVRKAIVALELMNGLEVDGVLDPDLLAQLDTSHQAIGSYQITDEDASEVTGDVPADYAEKAQLEFLGYGTVAEAVAEKFHMDEDLLRALNPAAQFISGEAIMVADVGVERSGAVVRIEADKSLRQLRAYDENDMLIAAYPATIGSEDNPSPSGSHTVDAIAPMPNYTYNPSINFQQGDNAEVLTIPPGPNGPVGSMWIDLSEPTYGIHGTPEPSLIDKTGSHGCVRLTNWDAEELAAMVSEGVRVDFVGG